MTDAPDDRIAGRLPCRVAVERTNDHFCAHMLFGRPMDFQPGDSVLMHGDDIQAEYGDRFMVRREATVRRAGWLRRQWTKMLAVLEITGLYEVSFTGRRKL